MKKIIALGIWMTCFGTITAWAQDENDAIRYANINYFGTARGMGIGTALGSVGGDFSSLSVNPAGIGIYRRGELSFTPSFSTNNNEGSYLNEQSTATSSKLNFSSIGLVLTKGDEAYARKHRWKAASFGIGMNRMQNFTNEYSYTGKNYKNSIVNKWANDFNALGGLNTNTINSVNYPAFAAYETYLIDRDPNDSTKAMSYVPASGGLQQTKTVVEKGNMQEYVISGGGNYMEKLMIGGTIGIVNTKYRRSMQFDEDDISGNDSNDFKYLRFTESLLTEGTGFNVKLGMIYKFNKAFRLGFAVHTPTYIEFTDQSLVDMESHTESLLTSPTSRYSQDSTLAFNYKLNTPYRAIVSGTVLFNKYGFLTADVEYVDYASMRYNFGIGYESLSRDMNRVIQNTYQATTNIRVGGEVKIVDLSVRAGLAYYGSPYKNQDWDNHRRNISVGVGYRAKNWFIDLGFVQMKQTNYENPYVLGNTDTPSATITKNTGLGLLTWGWKF